MLRCAPNQHVYGQCEGRHLAAMSADLGERRSGEWPGPGLRRCAPSVGGDGNPAYRAPRRDDDMTDPTTPSSGTGPREVGPYDETNCAAPLGAEAAAPAHAVGAGIDLP